MRRRDLNVRSKQALRTSYEQVEEVRRVAVCRESASHDYGHPGRRRSNPCQPLAARRSHLWRAGDHTYAAIFRSPRRSRLEPGSSAVLLPSRSIRWDERCLCLGNLEDLQCHDSDRHRLRPPRGGHGGLGLQPAKAAHGHADRPGIGFPLLRDRPDSSRLRCGAYVEFLLDCAPMALECRIGDARDLLLHAGLLLLFSGLREPSSGSGTLLLYGHQQDQGVASLMGPTSAPDLSIYAHWSLRIPPHAPVFSGGADAPGWQQGPSSLADTISAVPLSTGRRSVRAGLRNLPPSHRLSSLLAAARCGGAGGVR